MEARIARVVFLSTLPAVVSFILLFVLLFVPSAVFGAGYRTANFTVAAPSPQLAQEIGDQAEACRAQLAVEWLGQELPSWSQPCPIHAQVAPGMGAGGKTTFIFDRGEVYGWKMDIQGSRERLLDSVVPHEVTHTIFASHFRQPLPRWADEGACTTVEHRSEISKQERNLIAYLQTGRGIPFSQMFAMKEYPRDVLPLYAQGHSLSAWLIEQHGRKAFLEFLADGMRDENWPRAVRAHYRFDSLLAMQNNWNDWVRQGRPTLGPTTPGGVQLAANAEPGSTTQLAAVPGVRLQSPDPRGKASPLTPIAAGAVAAPPIPQGTGPTAITVASPNESIYAAAGRPVKAVLHQEPTANSPVFVSSSVYDSTHHRDTIRR
ncbi:MAG: hypothetical protein IT425_00145 [Pirellulales bacterium]|nr:hypothetical protein [Pirellulales bacterium]